MEKGFFSFLSKEHWQTVCFKGYSKISKHDQCIDVF